MAAARISFYSRFCPNCLTSARCSDHQCIPGNHQKQEKVGLQPEQGQRADPHQHHSQCHPARG